MILQPLVQLAENEKLIADPDFEFKPVAWVVRLRDDGELVAIEDYRQNLNEGQVDKKGKPAKAKWAGRKMLVPIQFVRTSGDASYFAVDKADYVFGITAAKPNRLGLFYEKLEGCASVTNDAAALAAVTFGRMLAAKPADERAALLPKDLTPGDLIAFRVGEDAVLLHDRPSVMAYWKTQRNQPDDKDAKPADRRCLITWKPVAEVPLFRKVKNMPGDASGGLSLVSFNSSAWESYGWAGEDNAPASREASEAAVTALSRLLDPRPLDGQGKALPIRRIRLGDDTGVVFWSPQPVPDAQDVLNALPTIFDPPDDVSDVGNLFAAVRTGVMKPLTTPAAFYAMTLTSVTGRIVLRDWLESTVAELQTNLRQHFDDLNCVRNTALAKGQPPRGVMRLGELMDALASPGREANIPTALAAAFVHAAFRGTDYPFGLLTRALVRERAESGGDEWIDSVRHDARAAKLKAVLNRRRRYSAAAADRYPEVLNHMDPTNTNIGYNLGALLAVLERLQAAALNDVNASIVDKYFNAASATPRNAFDRLLRNARHHARKAQDDSKTAGQAYTLERLIDELVSRFHAPAAVAGGGNKRMPTPPAVGFPVSLDLEQQGLFVIGYHHMRRFLWMSREERDAWQPSTPTRRPHSCGSARTNRNVTSLPETFLKRELTMAIDKRYDFVFLFDVTNGNPNGDPDAGNSPRIDPETGHGLVSDVCIKRKIRNYVTLAQGSENPKPGYDIYVKEKAILNAQHARAYEALKDKGAEIDAKSKKSKPEFEDQARQWMCQTFFDVRMFGAVMSTGVNAGQVRGPVQVAFSTSVDPIISLEQSITRMAVTTEEESKKQDGGNRTMGRKEIVPYGLYRCHGFVNASLARQTGFSEADLELLWQALINLFEHDRSASRGEMASQKLFVFEHDNALGSAPAHKLFERVKFRKKDPARPARSFHDYEQVDAAALSDLPTGVKLHVKL